MRIIVAGSRDFEDYEVVSKRLIEYFNENKMLAPDITKVEIVSGTARGVDRLGERFAKEYGCELKRMPANWEYYGKRAGMIRNSEMARYAGEDPDKEGVLFAFWDGKSRGTKGMIDIAYKAGLEVIVVRIDKLKEPFTIEELKSRLSLHFINSFEREDAGFEVSQYDILLDDRIIGNWIDNSAGCIMDDFIIDSTEASKELKEIVQRAIDSKFLKSIKSDIITDDVAYHLNFLNLLRKLREAGGVVYNPDYSLPDEYEI